MNNEKKWLEIHFSYVALSFLNLLNFNTLSGAHTIYSNILSFTEYNSEFLNMLFKEVNSILVVCKMVYMKTQKEFKA